MSIQNLLDTLTRAVSFHFKEDGTSPGITISSLKKGYYASVVRHPNGPKGKIVVCSARGDTLDQAIEGVAKEFLIKVNLQPDPVQQLDTLVRKS